MAAGVGPPASALRGAVSFLTRLPGGGRLARRLRPRGPESELGVSVDASFERDGRDLTPSELNVVGDGPDRLAVSRDARLAVNVNRPADLELARRLVERRPVGSSSSGTAVPSLYPSFR